MALDGDTVVSMGTSWKRQSSMLQEVLLARAFGGPAAGRRRDPVGVRADQIVHARRASPIRAASSPSMSITANPIESPALAESGHMSIAAPQ